MKHYTIDGKTCDKLPDPCHGVSPMTEERFIALGGTITDDGEPTPEERVRGAFANLIAELARKTDKITPKEFLATAQNGISSDLIAFARERGVPDAVIAEGRARIVEIMTDALRFGMSWDDLLPHLSSSTAEDSIS